MGSKSEAANKHFLVIEDRASKLLFTYPLPNKTAENMAKKLLELLLTFGIPLSAQRSRHGVHRRDCPVPLLLAQRDDRLWTYRPPKGSRSCREVGGVDPRNPCGALQELALARG